MEKYLGAGTVVLLNGYELTQYLQNSDVQTSTDMLDATTYGAKRKAYKIGLDNGAVTIDGLWDANSHDAVVGDALDDVLSTNLGGSEGAHWLVFPFGATFGDPGYGLRGTKTKYDINENVADLVKASAECSIDFRDRVEILHVLQNEAASGNGADLDGGALSLNGGVCYLMVPALSMVGGDTLTVKVQHSADGITWADLITFADVTADHGNQRIEVAGTIQQHVRAIWTLSAGADATFIVAFARK